MGDPFEDEARRRYGAPAPAGGDPFEEEAARRYGGGADPFEAEAKRRYGDQQTLESLPKMAEVATEAARIADPAEVRKARADINQRFKNPSIRRELRRRWAPPRTPSARRIGRRSW